VISPADAFRATANAAARAYESAPPFLRYQTTSIVDIPALNKHTVIQRAVETRTADDYAVLQDLPRGQRQYGHSFPLIPTFDAISYFSVNFTMHGRDVLSSVTLDQPITFSDPTPSDPNVAVMTTFLRYYYATDAPDTTDAIRHLVMQPLPKLTAGNRSDFYLHDLYIDTATQLPTKVIYMGPKITFELDYTMVENHWLINHAHYERTLVAPLHIGTAHFSADATFDHFTFPATPDDPKLAAPPSPVPKTQ